MGMKDNLDSSFDRMLTIQVFAASLMIVSNIGEYSFLVVDCVTD